MLNKLLIITPTKSRIMTKNKERIWIHHDFIESGEISSFIELYDISLTRFMMQFIFKRYNSFNHSCNPEEIIEVEKDFIKTTLAFLKERKEELKLREKEVLTSFLNKKKLTFEEFVKRIEKEDDDLEEDDLENSIHIEHSNYLYKNLPEKILGETTSFRMKINFLLLKANKIGCVIDLKDDFKVIEQASISDHIDLSNTKATEKLIYLKELGIIDHLQKQKPFTSINKLATVLSAITDERITTLQPALNAMINTTNSPEKDPYYSKNTAPRIKSQLINLGFDVKK